MKTDNGINKRNRFNFKKCRWRARDSNPGPQDGRCRQIQLVCLLLKNYDIFKRSTKRILTLHGNYHCIADLLLYLFGFSALLMLN